MENRFPDNKARRCKGVTKKGQRCGAAATAGGLCYFHANPDKASELGRIGGKKNRRFSDEELTPLPKLDSAAAIADVIERLISDIHKGQLHPKTASALVQLLNLKLRAIESMNHAERLARLEKLHPSDADNEG
ncbi:MAG: DUF5763 domain-containing protein [Acidobacteriota bacterium]